MPNSTAPYRLISQLLSAPDRRRGGYLNQIGVREKRQQVYRFEQTKVGHCMSNWIQINFGEKK